MTDISERRGAYLDAFGEGPGYLDFARVGPLSRPVIQARSDASALLLNPTSAVIDTMMQAQDQCIATAAAIAGFPATNLVYVPNTSIGLFQIAFALGKGSGRGSAARDQLLVSAQEFPANIYPWVRAEAAGRLRPVFLEPRRGAVTAERIAAAVTDRTAAVSVSAVDFRTGYRTDLSQIRSAIGDRWLIVDGIQAFGALPMDWAAADAVVVGGQKWLRSGWGTGFVAVSDRLAESWDPLLVGWTGVTEPVRYDSTVHTTMPGAPALSITNLSPMDQAAFAAGLGLVESVGIDWIGGRIAETAGRLAAELRAVGAVVHGDPGGSTGSGIVPVTMPEKEMTVVHSALTDAGISCTLHRDRVRLSVHATTTDASIEGVIHALSATAGRTP